MGVARPRASKKASKKGRDFIKSIPRLRSALRVTVLEEWRFLSGQKQYQEQMALWDHLETAFLSKDKRYQKQKMRKFCRHPKAIVASGDGDKNGTLRGTVPIMSTKLFKKVSQSCC
jgi:hypothetical protein